MNPRARGPSSNLLKCGSVLLSNPYEIRLPSIACCPRHEIICEIFKSLPFDPESTSPMNRFDEFRLFVPIPPASLVAVFRIFDTFASNSASFDFPVLFSKIPRWTWSIKFFTSVFFFVMTSTICVFVVLFAIRSLMPTLYACDFIYSVMIFWSPSIKSAAAIFPKSLQTR